MTAFEELKIDISLLLEEFELQTQTIVGCIIQKPVKDSPILEMKNYEWNGEIFEKVGEVIKVQ